VSSCRCGSMLHLAWRSARQIKAQLEKAARNVIAQKSTVEAHLLIAVRDIRTSSRGRPRTSRTRSVNLRMWRMSCKRFTPRNRRSGGSEGGVGVCRFAIALWRVNWLSSGGSSPHPISYQAQLAQSLERLRSPSGNWHRPARAPPRTSGYTPAIRVRPLWHALSASVEQNAESRSCSFNLAVVGFSPV
jgi:hypothetical protein